MNEEDEYSPSEFYYPEDLEKSDVETGTCISESHLVIDYFINNCKQKSGNNMNILPHYMEANGVKLEESLKNKTWTYCNGKKIIGLIALLPSYTLYCLHSYTAFI